MCGLVREALAMPVLANENWTGGESFGTEERNKIPEHRAHFELSCCVDELKNSFILGGED